MSLKEKIEIGTSVISMLSIFFGMWFGFYQIKSTLLEQRFSNRLELADDLMSKYISLSEYASKASFYLVADANDQAKRYCFCSNGRRI